MTPLSRYDPNASTETGMIAHSSGDWVPFDEALARIAELDAQLAHAHKQTAELVETVEAYILELDGSLITPMLCVNKIEGAVKRLAQLKEQDDE